tara:strand:- start:21 stop:335 length:315 start_codon:yes stop_codon:yes gene_type:complete
MALTTEGDMPPFSFPNPSVQSKVTNPDTGDTWIFEDGVWMLADPNDPDGPIPESNHDCPTNDSNDELELMINTLQIEIIKLRNDIIELKAELQTASVNNFLILE